MHACVGAAYLPAYVFRMCLRNLKRARTHAYTYIRFTEPTCGRFGVSVLVLLGVMPGGDESPPAANERLGGGVCEPHGCGGTQRVP